MSTVRGRRNAREPKVFRNLKEAEQDQVHRKTLSVLQPAADNPGALVGSCGSPASRKVKMNPVLGSIENTPMKLRRSKRKATVPASETSRIKSSIPLSNITKESTSLKKKTSTKNSKKLVAKLKENDLVIQEEAEKKVSEPTEARLSGISIQTESSGYCSGDGLEKSGNDLKLDASVENKFTAKEAADGENCPKGDDPVTPSVELLNTPSISQDVYDLLISDKVPNSYWKDLAETRRLELEEALLENESLHDQLEVLEKENSWLKSVVDDAENLADLVKDVLAES